MSQKRILRNRVAELMAIKARRDGMKKLSNRQVCEDTGLPKLTVDHYVKNEVTRYDASTLLAFAEYFECDIADLLVFEEVKGDSINKIEGLLLPA